MKPASQELSVTLAWSSPPGYRGPVMFQGSSNMAGVASKNASGIFIVEPNTLYSVNSALGTLNTGSITGFKLLNTPTVVWWPDHPCHQAFTKSDTWHSPVGYTGPVLTYNNGYLSGSFAALPFGYIDGLNAGGVSCVQVAGVSANTSYAVSGTLDSPTLVVWFP